MTEFNGWANELPREDAELSPAATHDTPESLYSHERSLTTEDRPLLEALGCEWPEDGEQEAWLAEMNNLIALGSTNLSMVGYEELREKIVAARQQFFSSLPKIHKAVSKESASVGGPEAPLNTSLGALRLLSREGVDVVKVVNKHPRVLRIGGASLTEGFKTLRSFGINATKVVHDHPPLLGLSWDSIAGKLDHYAALGLNARKVVNTEPMILARSQASVTQKMANLKALGLDAIRVVNSYPNVLMDAAETTNARFHTIAKHGIDAATLVHNRPDVLQIAATTFDSKMRILYSAARAWGVEDYVTVANKVAEKVPALFRSKGEKLRTIMHIANMVVPARTDIPTKDIMHINMANLELLVAAYLEPDGKYRSLKEVTNGANRLKYNKVGKEAVMALIAEHPDDPVVKIYRRGYSPAAR